MAQQPCTNLTDLDFSTDGSGNPLSSGMIIANQLSAAYGITVQAINNDTSHPDIAMIFNSAAPTGDDWDLGTPNSSFGGPGIGSGGNPSNNQPLGNLLIISEDGDQNDPDDEFSGGELRLNFANPTYVSALTLVDVDRNGYQVRVRHNGSQWTTINVPNMGDNSVQTVNINQTDVNRVRVILCGSGGLAGISFCNSTNPLNVSVAGADLVCWGDSTTVQATVGGGLPPYTYQWSNGATTSSIYTGQGYWSVTVTDNNGAVDTSGMFVNGPQAPLTISGTQSSFPGNVQISCAGANDGWINCNASGSFGTYSYNWSNGAQTPNVNNLSPGSYTVTVTDLMGCTADSSFQVNAPAPVQLSFSKTDVPCYGSSTGSAGVTVNGGTAPYTYSWSNNASSASLNSVPAGTYAVTVTDANNCVANGQITVVQPSAPLSLSLAPSGAICSSATGSIASAVSGGTAPYTYAWSNNTSSSNLSNVPSGNYTLTVTDSNGCQITKSAIIGQVNSNMSLSLNVTDVLCHGNATGDIACTVNGGTGPFTYAWSNNSSTSAIAGLSAGNYSLTVTDSNGCQAIQNAVVNQPTAALSTNMVANDVLCHGDATGSIASNVNGGTAPYNYLWSNASTGDSLTHIVAGNYSLLVTDANGCTLTANQSVSEPAAAVAVTSAITDVSCFGESNGAIDLQVSGGTAPYFVMHENTEIGTSLSNLPAATYQLTITDMNGCASVQPITVSGPSAELTANIESINPSCGQADGSILPTISGGTAPYSISMLNGQTEPGNDLNNLLAGTYQIEISDANGCEYSEEVTLATPQTIVLTEGNVTPDCEGTGEGAINISPEGFIGTPTFSWINLTTNQAISTGQNLSNLSAGEYQVTVSDEEGSCPVVETFVIPAPLVIDPVVRRETCPGRGNGGVSLKIEGGTEPYSILWETGDVTSDLENLEGGQYQVQISDANGCQREAIVAVETMPVPVADAGQDLTLENCATTAELTAHSPSGSAVGTWTSPNPDLTFHNADGAFTGLSGLAPGNENIAIWTVDRDGCTASDTLRIRVICEPVNELCEEPNMPNLLTPNGDDCNDVLRLHPLPANTQLRIMNRWGNEVYASPNYDNKWQGMGNGGKALPEGTYFVLVKYCPEDERILSGFIHIER
jgi:gliding motility-associated-like protein